MIGEPILLSKSCIGLSTHSGAPSSIVSRGSKVHVVWAEATDPEEKVPGVPTYVVTYDRETKTLGKPALIGYGPPANDIHNTPSITMDSRGYLHALAGTHGRPFQYARSLKPNDSGAGWTEAVPTGGDGSRPISVWCAMPTTRCISCPGSGAMAKSPMRQATSPHWPISRKRPTVPGNHPSGSSCRHSRNTASSITA